jgi:hypothetical protein
VRRLLWLRPGSPALAKAEGMVRFYREGRRPLAEQVWPAALADQGADATVYTAP